MKKEKDQQKRNRIWLYLFGAMAAYGGAKLIKVLLAVPQEAASIGIIGGADGPTAIFVTSRFSGEHIITALLMVVGIWGFIHLIRKGKR